MNNARTTQARDAALNDMLVRGRFLEAFDRFYHDEVVMQENSNEPTRGKKENLEREKGFFGNVEEVEESTLVSSAVSGDVSLSEWVVRLRFKDGSTHQVQQAASRRWRDGLVACERFYYDAPAQPEEPVHRE